MDCFVFWLKVSDSLIHFCHRDVDVTGASSCAMLPFDVDANMSVVVNKMEDTFNTLAGNPLSFLNEVNCNIEEDMESDEGDCDGAYLSSDNE